MIQRYQLSDAERTNLKKADAEPLLYLLFFFFFFYKC